MKNYVSVWRLASIAAAVCVLGAVVTACGGSHEREGSGPPPEAETFCGLKLPEPADQALRELVGTDKPKTHGDGVRATAKDLAAGTAPGSNGHELCRAYASSFTRGTSITFGTVNELPQGGTDPRFTRYAMGAVTLAKPRNGVVYAECVSSSFHLANPKPVLIRGEIENRIPPDGKDDTVREENLRVLHAVFLAVARELRCKDDAGLPATFRMPPKA